MRGVVRPHVRRASYVIALVAFLVAACVDPVDPAVPDDAIVVDARVGFTSIEGGCWFLETEDGTKYDAVPPELRRRGLPVRAALRLRPDWSNYCPGAVAEVVWIRVR